MSPIMPHKQYICQTFSRRISIQPVRDFASKIRCTDVQYYILEQLAGFYSLSSFVGPHRSANIDCTSRPSSLIQLCLLCTSTRGYNYVKNAFVIDHVIAHDYRIAETLIGNSIVLFPSGVNTASTEAFGRYEQHRSTHQSSERTEAVCPSHYSDSTSSYIAFN